jgi:hypothetical protein
MRQKLLSREEFRLAVLSRDNNTCVLCDKPAADAHQKGGFSEPLVGFHIQTFQIALLNL